MSIVHCDFETCNGEGVDLTKVGAYVYAQHPATQIAVLCYAFDDEPVRCWTPGVDLPERLRDHVSTGGDMAAHNAQFERLIWNHVMPAELPTPTPHQWHCTVAQARSNGLPGSLDKAAKVAGLNYVKDKAGHAHMLKMTKKRAEDIGSHDLQRLADYCVTDVEVERELHNTLRPMTDDETYCYQLNERMNDRGIKIDRAFCEKIVEYMKVANAQLNIELTKITDGDVTAFTQVARLKTWLGKQGYKIASLDKRVIDLNDFDGVARRAIEIRQLGAKSSAAKYETLLRQANADDRVRGMCQFAGAGQTGRFSSKGAQLHNLPRDVLPDAIKRIAAIKRLSAVQYQLIYDEPIIHTASRLLRPALLPEDGSVFIVGDWKGVEAICVPWLAECEEEMTVWSDPDGDRYMDDYAAVFEVPRDSVTKDQRQVGKVIRLALQFCGGAGALVQMASQYGLTFTAEDAQDTVDRWRAANGWVLKYGDKLERAAKRAVNRLNTVVEVGKISYGAEEVNGKIVLRCLLPSGRVISYYDVEAGEGKYGTVLSAVKPREGLREDLWRGIFVENVAQAVCNDFLRESMARCADRRFPLVWHVHDEIVLELPPRAGLVEDVRVMMEVRPTWAQNFPLVADVDEKLRYSK